MNQHHPPVCVLAPTREDQPHSGIVFTSGPNVSPEVQYAYTEMSGGVNNSRLSSLTYPNGRVLSYNYTTGLDSNISRLSSLSDTSATLESYTYLGLGTVVRRSHPQTGVNLTYIQQSGDTLYNADGDDQYTGLDRFGRVIDQFSRRRAPRSTASSTATTGTPTACTATTWST